MSDSDEELEARLRAAWQGRVSGCMLGKAVEVFSITQGQPALSAYLEAADALPLRAYIPLLEDAPDQIFEPSCRDRLTASAADDDVNYSVLALELLEKHGRALRTEDVARAWLNRLPVGQTFTAERAAYRVLLSEGAEWFPGGADPGFDLALCSDNPYNDWIGAQIRADVYGWVAPGDPELAASLARTDAELSHRGDGVDGAAWTEPENWVYIGARKCPQKSKMAQVSDLSPRHHPSGSLARSCPRSPSGTDQLASQCYRQP